MKYRGHHFFQHSRYSLDNVIFILSFIEQNGKIAEPKGDHKDYKEGGSKEYTLENYITYVSLTLEYQSKFDLKGAQFNSVKKHLFPDMIEMNLIERIMDNNERYVVLTKDGIEMIEEQNKTNLQMKWARAITKNIHSKCPNFVISFIQMLERIQYITEEELIFFGSYLDYEPSYDYKKISKLIEYSRSLKTDYSKLKDQFRDQSKDSLDLIKQN